MHLRDIVITDRTVITALFIFTDCVSVPYIFYVINIDLIYGYNAPYQRHLNFIIRMLFPEFNEITGRNINGSCGLIHT